MKLSLLAALSYFAHASNKRDSVVAPADLSARAELENFAAASELRALNERDLLDWFRGSDHGIYSKSIDLASDQGELIFSMMNGEDKYTLVLPTNEAWDSTPANKALYQKLQTVDADRKLGLLATVTIVQAQKIHRPEDIQQPAYNMQGHEINYAVRGDTMELSLNDGDLASASIDVDLRKKLEFDEAIIYGADSFSMPEEMIF